MNCRTKTIIVPLSFLFTFNCFASDTTDKRNPILFSINAGYAVNRVYGSMVDRNKQFDETVEQKNTGSYTVNFRLQKAISKHLYFKTGLDYIKKQVTPQENSGVVYKARLKTHYLSFPLLIGISMLPADDSKLNVSVEFGPSVNFRLRDESYFGPDPWSTKTNFASFSLNPGLCLTYAVSSNVNLVLQYTYMHNVTDSYVEHLYWGSYTETIKKFVYKYNSQIFTLGVQWSKSKKGNTGN